MNSAVLVTGGASGLGAAVVDAVRTAGGHPYVLDLKPPADPDLPYLPVDLSDTRAAERAAKRTLDITLRQQEFGAASYLALLSARQAYQQALITRVQAQANRLADTAALFQALGGGWWNRPSAARTTGQAAER